MSWQHGLHASHANLQHPDKHTATAHTLHTHMRMHRHACTDTRTPTCTKTDTRTHMQTCSHPHTHDAPTHTHTHMRAHTPPPTHPPTHQPTHTHTHTCAHMHAHARTHEVRRKPTLWEDMCVSSVASKRVSWRVRVCTVYRYTGWPLFFLFVFASGMADPCK
jgi:hypothetical protein